MDEKVKESLKQVFELVGHAIFSAYLMEKELAFLITPPEIMKNKKLSDSNCMNQEIEKLNKCTFGQLLKKLGNHAISMTDETKRILEKALEKRNLLVHNFFHTHTGKLGDISEHGIMKNELVQMRDLFKSIYDKLHQESYRNLKNTGLIQENTENLL